MLTEPQQRWVDALRSGKFEQGQQCLCDGKKYCCLGVACEIFKEELDLNTTIGPLGQKIYNGKDSFLPEEVQKLLNLNDYAGRYKTPLETFYTLTRMNDEGYSFLEIADFIEQNPTLLFNK